MNLGSLAPGRLPNSLVSQRLARSIARGQVLLQRLQEQISSGRRFALPSEAPTAATQTLILQALDERRSTHQQNIQTSQGFLGATDQALSSLGDVLVQARGLLQAGVDGQATNQERAAMAQEVRALLQSALQAGNLRYNHRYLFAGSQTGNVPFTLRGDGSVRYSGNAAQLATFADLDLLVSTNADGINGLRGATPAKYADLNPAATLETRLEQLNGGAGLTRGLIDVRVTDGPATIRKTIDLTTAETLSDVKTRIEAAFASEAVTVTVDINPATHTGLRLTPSSGDIEVRDRDQGRTAFELGIRSGPAAVLQGNDLDPILSPFTPLTALNGGAGIGATAGTGLRIANGSRVSVVDLDGAVTLADVIDRIQTADPDVVAEISADGVGLTVFSRLSGVDFSIGENGGTNATALGLRTFTGAAPLSALNLGAGVPVNAGGQLLITRRDGTNVELNLSGATTVQDVLNRINAIDPGRLVAGLNAIGNGLSLSDNSGMGPLTVASNSVSVALGIDGTNDGGATGVLTGRDVNPQAAGSVFDLLARLATALEQNDLATLNTLANPLDAEVSRINTVRADVGSRQQVLERIDGQLGDLHVNVKEQLSKLFDTDLTETITQFLQQQQTLEAAMQVAARVAEVSILNYI